MTVDGCQLPVFGDRDRGGELGVDPATFQLELADPSIECGVRQIRQASEHVVEHTANVSEQVFDHNHVTRTFLIVHVNSGGWRGSTSAFITSVPRHGRIVTHGT